MKTKIKMRSWLPLLLSTALSLTSCLKERSGNDEVSDPHTLKLAYSVLGADEQELTKGVAGTSDENRVTGLYTLFFEPSADGSGAYIGCTYSGVTSSGASGTSRVGLPGGRNVQDAYSLVIIANLDACVDKGAHDDVAAYLDATIGVNDQAWVRANLLAKFAQTSGIKPPLLMSAEHNKPASTNLANITLTRAVARVDVINASTGNFQLVSAQIWNARNESFVTDHAGGTPALGTYSRYTGNVKQAVSNTVRTGLYFFENMVPVPVQNDLHTTCIIIGGYYNGSGTVTYYRVNVCEKGTSQFIERNHLYSIKITNVVSAGWEDPGDAYTDSELKINYTINDWNDDFNGGYVMDAYGNGLAVSKKSVTFSESGGQEEILEVTRIFSATNPIPGDWTVDWPMTGNNASDFEAEAIVASPLRYFKIRTLTDNNTTLDRTATATVRWGTLAVNVAVKQLNPFSQLSGLKVSPANLWFPREAVAAGAKQFSLDVLGNHAGLADPANEIQKAIIWGHGGSGWFTCEFDQDLGAGIYRFKVYPTPMTDAGMPYRDATIKLAIVVNGVALSASVYVRQSAVDQNYEASIRQLQVTMWRNNSADYSAYQDLGSLTAAVANNFRGFPAGQATDRDLHFAINEKRELKYRIKLTSTMNWRIEPKASAAARLDFSMTSFNGDGSERMHDIWVTANRDIVNDAAHASNGRWDASFDLVYENGDIETFYCHQTGCLAKLATDQLTYYYGTVMMNGRYWLDRNLGATSNGFYTNAGQLSNIQGNIASLGAYLDIDQAADACPAGFRLPKADSPADDEWDWVYTFATRSGGSAQPSGSYKNSWSVEYSASPRQLWWIPYGGVASIHNGTTYEKWGNVYHAYEYGSIIAFDVQPYNPAPTGTVSSTEWIRTNAVTGRNVTGKYLGDSEFFSGVADGNTTGSLFASWYSEGYGLPSFAMTGGWKRNRFADGTIYASSGGIHKEFLVRCIRDDN